MPVTPAIWDADIGGSQVQSKPDAHRVSEARLDGVFSETLSQEQNKMASKQVTIKTLHCSVIQDIDPQHLRLGSYVHCLAERCWEHSKKCLLDM